LQPSPPNSRRISFFYHDEGGGGLRQCAPNGQIYQYLTPSAAVIFAALIAVFAAAFAPSAAAQAQPSAVIAEIHVSGSTLHPEAAIAAASGLKPGDNVTRDQIQGGADRLTALGVFTIVNYKFSSVGAKIRIDFDVKDAPEVPVSFDNFPWLTDDQLTDAIRQAAPLFDGQAPTDGGELDQIASAISGLLKAHNLPGSVERRLIAHPTRDNAMLMQFRFTGPPVTMESIDFGGDLARKSPQLEDRQADLLHKPFSRFDLEVFENEQIRPLYLSLGYLRVQFAEPDVRLLDATASQPGSKVSVTLHINAGPAYRLGVVDWKNMTVLPGETLVNLMVLKAGDIADGMRLTAAWQRVTDEYARRGYLDAKLDPLPEFDDAANKVNYHVNVTEGPQYHMGQLVITGLALDAENALRYAWKVQRGAIFDGAFYSAMLAKLTTPKPEIFGGLPVHYTTFGHDLRVNPDRTADVLFDFK